MAAAVLVDANVILDVVTDDPNWSDWSSESLSRAGDESILVINPIIYAEVSMRIASVEELDHLLPPDLFRRDPLPYDAGFLAGKAFLAYKRSGGAKLTPLPDFYIGAHAAVAGLRLLTRDARRFRTYFPKLDILSPAR